MAQNILDFLGGEVSELLKAQPYSSWQFEKSLTDDLDEPIIHYVFPQNGLELRCDCDNRITVIFLFAEESGGFDDTHFEVPFSTSRDQILELFGEPSKSGDASSHPVLGDFGAWDRFPREGHAIRFEYLGAGDSVTKITLMTDAATP